jgi:hypothetical protein
MSLEGQGRASPPRPRGVYLPLRPEQVQQTEQPFTVGREFPPLSHKLNQ